MRFSRPIGLGLGLLAVTVFAATGYACENKNSQASATSKAKGTTAVVATAGAPATCTAAMAKTCTAGMAASCPHATSAQAVTAGTSGACSHAATAGAGSCASKGAAAAGGMARSSSCNDASKSAKGAKTASAAPVAQHDCDYCASMVACNDELKALGANIQVIMLKNGVAFLYTAGTSSGTNAVQAAMAHRSERDDQIARSGAKAHVCDECKAMRQAMAEGKISREVVRIEGGSMAIMTSSDPAIVAKFHRWAAEAKAEHDGAGRAKS